MKPDERALLDELRRLGSPREEMADAVGARLKMHPNRVAYVLMKWARRGWWGYGVSLRTGWLTEEVSRP